MNKRIKNLVLATFIAFIVNISFKTATAQANGANNTQKVWDIAFLALGLSTILGLFVVVLMIYFGWKYRESNPAPRKKISHKAERRLEIIWITLSLLMVIFATGVTLVYSNDIQATQTDVDVDGRIYVEARQFQWTFYDILPNGTFIQRQSTNLMLEAGNKYELVISSRDVIHSFFVYPLGIKHDAVPGRQASIFVYPDTPGSYEIRCAQYCGAGHYQMTGQQFIEVI